MFRSPLPTPLLQPASAGTLPLSGVPFKSSTQIEQGRINASFGGCGVGRRCGVWLTTSYFKIQMLVNVLPLSCLLPPLV